MYDSFDLDLYILPIRYACNYINIKEIIYGSFLSAESGISLSTNEVLTRFDDPNRRRLLCWADN